MLVLDFNGGRGAADGESVALLGRQRRDAGDTEDTGAQGEADYYAEPVRRYRRINTFFDIVGRKYNYKPGRTEWSTSINFRMLSSMTAGSGTGRYAKSGNSLK